jgi:hypothetical protein
VAGTPSGDDFSVTFDGGSGTRSATVHGSTLTLVDARGEHTIAFGYDDWVTAPSTFGTGIGRGNVEVRQMPLAARAAWADPSTWVLQTWAVEQPFGYRLELRFDGDAVTAELTVNVAFNSTVLDTGTGRRA